MQIVRPRLVAFVMLASLFVFPGRSASVFSQSRPQRPDTPRGEGKKNQRPVPKTEEELKKEEEERKRLEEEKNAITVMKWKEMFDLLEQATDRCEDCANVLESVVVKHG